MIMVESLIDSKKKREAKEAIAAGDGDFFRRKKPEPTGLTKANEELNKKLCMAAATGDIDGVKGALNEGANVNAKNDVGMTPLILASLSNKEIVELLIEKGANVNAKGNEGFTALMMAVINGNSEIVELLVGKGADVSVRNDRDGRTALEIAEEKDKTEIVEILRKAGATE